MRAETAAWDRSIFTCERHPRNKWRYDGNLMWFLVLLRCQTGPWSWINVAGKWLWHISGPTLGQRVWSETITNEVKGTDHDVSRSNGIVNSWSLKTESISIGDQSSLGICSPGIYTGHDRVCMTALCSSIRAINYVRIIVSWAQTQYATVKAWVSHFTTGWGTRVRTVLWLISARSRTQMTLGLSKSQ